MKRILMIALLWVASSAWAAGKPGIRVTEAWSRATPAVAPVAGGFMTLANAGDREDRLLRVESGIAQRVEIHEMRHEDGVMRMRQLADGLAVPAGGTVVLKPGGYHLMFIKPLRALAEGERFDATLVFQRAGKVKVVFDVRAMGAGGH